jgi:pimeloyl-ACP methyl ester carboxylesterase
MATRSRNAAPATGERPAPRLRRAYYDCRFGQLHIHNAIPAGGGFDELTPLVCIHGASRSGRVFRPLLAALGADRSIYAPDLPGCGESDPAPGGESVEAGAQAIGDFLESMRIRTVDLVAVGEGAAVLRRLALLRPAGLRRLVLAGEAGAAAPPSSHPVLVLGAVDFADPAAVAKVATFLA